MIEWIKWEKDNQPELNTLYLIKHYGGITSGKIYRSDRVRTEWISYNGSLLLEVTHYAEINLPNL